MTITTSTSLVSGLSLWSQSADGRPYCDQVVGLASGSGDTSPISEVLTKGRSQVVVAGGDSCRLILNAHGEVAITIDLVGSGNAACELWSGRKQATELSLQDAWYHGLERFARISRHVHFPAGSGLPGRAWAEASPQIISDLVHSTGFLRSSGAANEGLTQGLSFPVLHGTALREVAVILSHGAIAPLIERWPGNGGDTGPIDRLGPIGADHGALVRRAIASRRPQVIGEACAIPCMYADAVRGILVLAW